MKTSFALAALSAFAGVHASTTIECKGCPPSSSVEDIVTREPIPAINCTAPTLSVITKTGGGEGEHPGMPTHPGMPGVTGTGVLPTPTGAPSPTDAPIAAAGKVAGSVGAVAVAMAAYLL